MCATDMVYTSTCFAKELLKKCKDEGSYITMCSRCDSCNVKEECSPQLFGKYQ